ncbi:hypothetical protein [Bacillus weihaiensis]|uniref:Uncharacterized protein n=1 Tax=Bacillus weihaiensis TaxID=1547283 RepID=A0A1L3MUN7_9BACI|nr:hypothetical protein [Bacillus weihaiensis]APH06061.1 hypothetical protein A9C19_15660 [Bacillus weihaiensis]
MIWLYFFIPLIIIGGIAVYFEKRSGMTKPNEDKQADHLGEVQRHNRMNIHQEGSDHSDN